jgi:hypothetical protein
MMHIRKILELFTSIKELDPTLLTMKLWEDTTQIHPAAWIAFDQWFIDLGYEVQYPELIPMYNGFKGMEALEEFFDIDRRLLNMMFLAQHYPNPDNITHKDIVTRISHVLHYLESKCELVDSH